MCHKIVQPEARAAARAAAVVHCHDCTNLRHETRAIDPLWRIPRGAQPTFERVRNAENQENQ